MPNLRSSPNTIIFSLELTLNKFSRKNPKYLCICHKGKKESLNLSFFILIHTHWSALLVVLLFFLVGGTSFLLQPLIHTRITFI